MPRAALASLTFRGEEKPGDDLLVTFFRIFLPPAKPSKSFHWISFPLETAALCHSYVGRRHPLKSDPWRSPPPQVFFLRFPRDLFFCTRLLWVRAFLAPMARKTHSPPAPILRRTASRDFAILVKRRFALRPLNVPPSQMPVKARFSMSPFFFEKFVGR